MRKIIAITGLKGSGKDTTADYILNKEQGWEKDSYAGILKDIASILFGWDRKMLAGETPLDRDKREASDLYWSKKLGYDVTPRNMLQRLGTEVFRQHLHPNIWVDALERKIKDHDKNIIITDCRFKNEIDMLRANGGKVVRVVREPLPQWFDKVAELNQKGYNAAGIMNLVPEVKDVHLSEWDWIGYDNPDFILYNNGSFEDLYSQVDKMLDILK